MRIALGLIVGVVIAIGLISLIEAIGHQLYPPAAGVALDNPEAMAAYIERAPTAALLFPPLGWLIGAALGGWAAIRLSRRPWAGWVIAGLVLLGGIINLFLIPAPLWMQIAAIAAPILGGWIATRLPSGSAGPLRSG